MHFSSGKIASTKMFQEATAAVLFFYYVTATAQAKNLTIIRSEDNRESLVLSPSVTTHGGRNLSLICQVTESKDLLADRIMWGKRTEEFEYGLTTISDGRLTFNHITETDEGEYFCVSLKHELVRVLYLAVEPQFSLIDIRRNAFSWKRSGYKQKRSTPAANTDSVFIEADYGHGPNTEKFLYNNTTVGRNRTKGEEQKKKDETAVLIVELVVAGVVLLLLLGLACFCYYRHCRPRSAPNSVEMSSYSYSMLNSQDRTTQGFPPSYDHAAQIPSSSAEPIPPFQSSLPPYDPSSALFDSSPSSPPPYQDLSPSSLLQAAGSSLAQTSGINTDSPTDGNGGNINVIPLIKISEASDSNLSASDSKSASSGNISVTGDNQGDACDQTDNKSLT